MSSILTPYIRKRYKNIDELNNIFNINNKVCAPSDALYEGNIHSIYVKVDVEDYTKIFNHNNYNNIMHDQTYVFYSNNRIGVLAYTEKNKKKNVCETWDFVNSTVYSYDTVDVAYVVDNFKGRLTLPMDRFNNLSMRLNSYGSWCQFDSNLTIFIGKRILYTGHPKDLEYVNLRAREAEQLSNLSNVGARFSNIYYHINVREDYFVLFRRTNALDSIFNKSSIYNLLRSQKLEHLLRVNENLLIPLV
ncbi:hypothetical protein HgNV_086 [Homarus gammarus nudivirus]|uniref:Uncharacterized protein n=1 Tax=Homarus gammarus nudivirus TaxID=2509616 RepID=A0A411HB97_9VIRU|nr:hypothetical protein KM727_gp86 [Homarus gammarus nudivirus]QBB28691.1 hypothetical protein HgNV_086 [Homarus gammarus nudivirus]